MNFSAPLADFQKTLQKTLPAIPPKSSIQVLEHLNMSLEGNQLRIIGTDQDITIMSTLEVTGAGDGSVLVPAKKLNDIIKALGSVGVFEFTADADSFDIKLKTSMGKYGMKGLNPDEYLELPELFDSQKPELDKAINEGTIETGTPTASFPKADIIRLAEKTMMAVSDDDFRPAMTGVLFQFREKYVNAVSTDSYRLVKSTAYSENAAFPQDFDIIIPAKSVDLLRKSDSDVVMSVIEANNKVTHVRFDYGNTVFITRIIEEKFPPYETVIPNNNDFVLTVNKNDVHEAIKRVSIFTSSVSKQIRLRLQSDTLTISGEDEESGNDAVESISCEYHGDELQIAFNFKYLVEALDNIDSGEAKDDHVLISFSESSKPALISPKSDADNLLMLIMPVRISE